MKSFTNNECFLVKQDTSYGNEFSISGNCHLNVQKLIKRFGGKQIYGWQLVRDNNLVEKGIWIWIFHSIWEKPNGELIDTTKNDIYKNMNFNTFWIDSNREADTNEGTAYNSIVIFSDNRIADFSSHLFNCNINKGEIYWTLPSMSNIRTMNQHDGKYRLLNKRYEENHRLLKEKYGIEIVGGRLVTIHGRKAVNDKIMFDFSVNI